MTLQACTEILAPFALALRAEMDEPSFRAYYQVLKDVPVVLLQAAIDAACEQNLRFMPSAPELRGRCEVARRRLLDTHPYDGCSDCEHQKGWQTITDGTIQRVRRCQCFARHQAKLARLGIDQPLAKLRPARAELESVTSEPALDELPPAISDQIRAVSQGKRL